MTNPTTRAEEGAKRTGYVEDGCRVVYGRTWDGPFDKMPTESMKDVWRELVEKAQRPAVAAMAAAESRAASAEAEVERYKAQRLAQIDYSVALQRIIEAICHGHALPEAGATAAPHHHAMALAAEASASALRDRVAVLESALNDLLPGKLCGESWGEADSSRVSIGTSFGAIRAARAALKGGSNA